MKRISALPATVDFLLAGLIGLAAFAAYARTLVPGLLPSDGAEFQTLTYTLEHAHTTGYDVYLVLARLFCLLPVNDIAYRVNLFSAFMGGLAVSLVFITSRMLSDSRWGAGMAALTLAVSATFWSQAIIAEVYTAGAVFTALVVYLVLRWHFTHHPRDLFAAGVLGGLGFGVHGSVVLLAPPVLLLLLVDARELRRAWKATLGGALTGALGLILAFAVVDARNGTSSIMNTYIASATSWGLQPQELGSPFGRFLFLIFARQWRSAMFVDPVGVIPNNFGHLTTVLGSDFALPVILLVWLGLFVLCVWRWKIGLFFAAAIVTHLVYTLNYRIGDIYVFYLSLYIYLALLAGEGTAFLLRRVEKLPCRQIGVAVAGMILIALALVPFAPARAGGLQTGETRFDFMNLPSNRELVEWRAWIRDVTPHFPRNAVVMIDWYNLYGFAYTAQIEHQRGDLMFIEAYPYSSQAGLASSLPVYLRDKIHAGSPVYAFEYLDDLVRRGFNVRRVLIDQTTFYRYELP